MDGGRTGYASRMSEHPRDESSDPSLDDGTSTDWSGEGGAVPEGPATDPDDGSDEVDAHDGPSS
ncbi:hypothetical protein EXE57_10880 [Nocardioides euryhalodurans]|uniref:Uncharacterized protein n=2 Tax=Nocardioides euryhalodurans TaxID=2518370 RepID=A0A4P7GLM8_9ACTN|nr:hypothetical protein EXE57_10880 [Nocardioides euryhalodurans]